MITSHGLKNKCTEIMNLRRRGQQLCGSLQRKSV